jgi:hypothetical protein
MMILYDNPSMFRDASAEDMQRVIQQYSAWRRRLAEAGQLKDGNKLTDAPGRILSRTDGRTVVRDGPFSEVKEGIGGYFLIEAGDYDEMVALAGDCPHLLHGGTIEIREVRRGVADDATTSSSGR